MPKYHLVKMKARTKIEVKANLLTKDVGAVTL